jgi:hypothetical protein
LAVPDSSMDSPLIYLGGPIDYYGGDPDERHTDLRFELPVGWDAGIYCPYCEEKRHPLGAETRIANNNVQLSICDWAVFVWDVNDPSIGTPIEIYQRAVAGRSSIVVGTLGSGMFAQWLVARGVLVVDSMEQAAALVAQSVGVFIG